MKKEVILGSAYLGPVEYYTKLFAYDTVRVERYDHYMKQTYRNRCVIASADGPLALTIPTEKGDDAKCLMKDIRISDHGNWRHVHWNAFVAAIVTALSLITMPMSFTVSLRSVTPGCMISMLSCAAGYVSRLIFSPGLSLRTIICRYRKRPMISVNGSIPSGCRRKPIRTLFRKPIIRYSMPGWVFFLISVLSIYCLIWDPKACWCCVIVRSVHPNLPVDFVL